LEWIVLNKEWVLSGIGVFIIDLFLFSYLYRKKSQSNLTKQTGKKNINVAGDVIGNINIENTEFISSKKEINFKFILILAFLILSTVFFIFLYFIFGFKSNDQNIQKLEKEIIERETQLKVDIYQFGDLNYNPNILKYILLTLNGTQPYSSYKFVLHDTEDLDMNFINKLKQNFDYENNFAMIIKLYLRLKDKLSKNNLAIALVNIQLFSNLFSSASRFYVSVISTYDWNFEIYKPPTVYEYIVHMIILNSLLSSTSKSKEFPIKAHKHGETCGCVFDYNYEKLNIRNQIYNPILCDEHKNIIIKNFDKKMLEDTQFLLSLNIFKDDKIKKDLKKLYDFSF